MISRLYFWHICFVAIKFCNFFGQESDEFISRSTEKLLNLMIEALPANHFSAKRYRLDCLYSLIVHVTKVTHILLWIKLWCVRFVPFIALHSFLHFIAFYRMTQNRGGVTVLLLLWLKFCLHSKRFVYYSSAIELTSIFFFKGIYFAVNVPIYP